MIKLKACFTFLCIILILSGCSSASPDTADRIERPENKVIPLQGTWKIEECYNQGAGLTAVSDTASKWVGATVGFEGDKIAFGSYYWNGVSYKIKRVNAEEYFLHKYKDAITRFGIKDKEIIVITASSDEKFLYEFVKTAEDRIVVNIDDEYFCVKKISSEFEVVLNGTMKGLTGSVSANSAINSQLLRSGLLLGVRIPVKTEQKNTTEQPDEYLYRTYWIARINNVLNPVLTADNVFLPRKDGFWRLQVFEKLGSEGIEDFLSASMVSGSMKEPSSDRKISKASERVETKVKKAILYVGNDYVCVENTIFNILPDSSKTSVKKVLRTLPIDNLSNTEGIKLSDFAGDNGSIAIDNAITDLLSASGTNGIKGIDEVNQDENFALYRKTGHWFFKGRLNLAQNEPLSFMDFNINLIPPPDMVAYDMLQVPWTVIKDRMPAAVDAYTSPNKDIAIVLTRTAIMIYELKGGILSESPIKRMEIPEGSSVIMAEWATGDYVQNWEKAFIKNNTINTVETE